MFRDFVSSGRVVDLVLAVLAAEFGWLSWRGRPPRAKRTMDLVCALAPGAFLALALRVALRRGDWTWIAGLLAVSMPMHVADLRRRGL